jgi:ferric-dicitrate binding protein FerR (iron transport regulator)
MTDRRPPELNDNSDVSVEQTLRDGLVTRPLNEEAQARLHAAAAQAWRAATLTPRNAMVASQRWRRRIGFAVAASLAAVAVAFFATRPVENSSVVGSIARLKDGGIEVRSWVFGHRTLQVGDALRVGDTLTVRGPTLVTLARGGTLRIAAGSILGVTGVTQLSMERGLIYVDMPPSDSTNSNPLRVTTRAGAVEHVGTEFEVMSDDQTVRIRVREGQIRLLGQSQTIVADAGTELLATPRGQVTQRPIDTFGRDWLWIAALAPDYEIEGRPLIGFLRWVGREMGRSLEFADAHAREVADHAILHGSVKGQSPLDALSTVLATTSLTYEISGDALRIHSGP